MNDKKMEFVKSENGINYYLFKPSLFSLYYNDKSFKHNMEPPHRFSILHILHMMLYCGIFGGYRILYLEKNDEIISYIIFTKANRWIVRDCGKNDYYTIFLWTYPEHRGRGIATAMSKTMLSDLGLNYNRFYKTIAKDNISSVKVADKCGFRVQCDCAKTRFLHTIYRVGTGNSCLYSYSKQ